MTYRHLLLETKRSKKHPIFLGPTLIHYRKTFGAYLFFASTLVGMSPELQGVRAFGTDGEQALAQALGHAFPFSERLLCFIHARRNIKERCREFFIPTDLEQKIMNDVFGSKVNIEGLVDAQDDDEFQRKLDAVMESWQGKPVSSTTKLDSFINWFNVNKSSAIRNYMLRPIREECGLGCPPEPFTTNASESINAVLKNKLDYQRSELPNFVEKIREVVNEQQKELERAVIGRGKYQLQQQYKFLEVPENKWFRMSLQQRKDHLSKLQSVTIIDINGMGELESATSAATPYETIPSKCSMSDLSVDVENAAAQVNIPSPILQGIWAKARTLLSTDGAIASAPGQSPEARMVLSYSRKVPHMVTPRKGSEFSCDSSCPNWKSLGLCSHSIAVAELNGKLLEFISAKKKKKRFPNITSLVTTGMPKGRGRKGGVAPHVRKPSRAVTTRIEMNIPETSSTNHIASAPMSDIHTVPPPQFSTTPQFCSSPDNFYSSHGYYNWGMRNNVFPQSSFQIQPSYEQLQPPIPGYYTVPFTYSLHIIGGNISTCFGCKNKYNKSLKPLNDLCIKTQDWREFITPNSATPQSRFGNVYFHCKPECVLMRNPSFLPSYLNVPDEVAENLNDTHKQYLLNFFGLQI